MKILPGNTNVFNFTKSHDLTVGTSASYFDASGFESQAADRLPP
jgi:hypothetical protein